MCAPLVSVCIPAYNHEKYVERTIRSIIAQTYKRLELIVIDDGSKDNTWNIIQGLKGECEARFERVVFETQPNSGTCVTVNRLFSCAGGKYVYLIASDDESLSTAVEKLYTAMLSGDCVLAVGDNYIIDDNSNRVAWDDNQNIVPLEAGKYKTFKEFFSRDQNKSRWGSEFGSYSSLIHGNYIPNGYLIRKSSIAEFGGCTPSAPLEDWYMHLQLSKRGRFVFVDEPLFNYRWHGGNTAANHKRMVEMSAKTLLFEKGLLEKANDASRLLEFRKHSQVRRKVLLKIPFVLAITDCRDFDLKYREVILIGRRFVFRERGRR